MRIVIDMQGAQTGSRFRGIGRYTMALALAMVRNGRDHEFILALNGLFPETIDSIRDAFHGLLPPQQIRVWHSVGPVHSFDPANTTRKDVAELIREEFLLSLQPDIVHITSLIEGFGDNAVHSIGRSPFELPTAVTFYDLIPLIQSEVYLKPNPHFEPLYREKISHLNHASLMLAISESSRREALEYLDFSEEQVVNISAAVDDNFQPLTYTADETDTLNGKFGVNRSYLMYSGATDDRKNHLGLIDAYALLPQEIRDAYQLVLVGGLPDDHRYRFEQHIAKVGLSLKDVLITGRVSDDEMVQFYNQCALYVFPSQHEGFGLPALEALSCGAVVIGSNTTSIPEVIGSDEALFDPYDIQSMADKITEVLTNKQLYARLKDAGIEQSKKFSWDISATKTLRAFEQWHEGKINRPAIDYNFQKTTRDWLYNAIAQRRDDIPETMAKRISQCIATHTLDSPRQLLVDVSEMVQRDSRTGVQRVVRGILRELLLNPPAGFVVEPVYANDDELGYKYARAFTGGFLGNNASENTDDTIDFCQGDVFLGLDMQHRVQERQATYYRFLRRQGVDVFFVLYDLLPLLTPQFFPPRTYSDHAQWISLSEYMTGYFCISETVAEELKEWMTRNGQPRKRPLVVDWFHIGADIENSNPSSGLPNDAESVLGKISQTTSFLMVGTLEPRKGQAQALAAMETLWADGKDVSLVIVGKQGWNIDELAHTIRTHSMADKKLFWLEAISDEYLEKVYAASTCLLAASEGEGFGLPLIEAAQHRLPIIARDIPVFHEVAAENAYYFEGHKAEDLAAGIVDWIKLHDADQHPTTDGLSWLTWQQSAAQMCRLIQKHRNTA